MNEKHFSLFHLGVASIDSSHFQTLLTPQSVLCASFLDSTQTNDSPSGHIWSHENIHQLPPQSVQTRSHDVSDMGGWCDVRGCLMDGPTWGYYTQSD